MTEHHDWHMHTTVSDGKDSPALMREAAKDLKLTSIAITDHDALDAHVMLSGEPMDGIEVVKAVEIDCSFNGRNIEILGYYIDVENKDLAGYLAAVQKERRERALRYIDCVNDHFGKVVIKEQDVMPEGRVTILKPHILQPLVSNGLFANYGEAKKFLNSSPVKGFKRATAPEAITMIKGAGGMAVLAHPGVYDIPPLEAFAMIKTLRQDGIDGVETYYPYHLHMPDRYDSPGEERQFVEKVESLAKDLGLKATRGSDSHSISDLVKYNS
ncbi:MAG: PHP domain-containing protein [Candidatus Eremiobacteraeota bacterium]|nr:PHP domain-containing protein [Candidatus Eremiobacteraeota bacterium]